jgi:hypothetical protein
MAKVKAKAGKLETIDFQPTRLVLTEKSNPKLELFLKKIASKEMGFKTEVHPLPNNQFLVYQESHKLAKKIFYAGKHVKAEFKTEKEYNTMRKNIPIVFVRVFIIKKIISKTSKFLKLSWYQDFYSEVETFSGLFIYGSQLSFSAIIAIPKDSASKKHFINYCLQYHYLRGKKLSLEAIPIYKLLYHPAHYDINRKTLIDIIVDFEKRPKETIGDYLKARIGKYRYMEEDTICDYENHISLYHDGTWEAHNKVHKNTLNKQLNMLDNKRIYKGSFDVDADMSNELMFNE